MKYQTPERKIKTITITLTQSCNLKCSYCYENNKSPKAMTFSTAQQIIDKELQNKDKYTGFEIDLFGGEPFLQFELIKQITNYACQELNDFPHTIFLTTNGTLVHGDVQKWLIDHKDCVICGLSLDGTREMHNTNRSNSFDSIDIDFFAENYPMQDIKMTISRETLPTMAEGVMYAHKRGFEVSCNLAYGIDWSDPDNVAILDRELHKLIDFYIANPQITPCSMLSMGITNVLLEDKRPHRHCGAGIEMTAYDVDGRSYPCQFFMPLSVGEEKASKAKDLKFYEDFIPSELADEKCRDCVINRCCPNCYGSNYASTGNIYHRDINMCRLTKIMVKACSYFYAMQWQNGQLNVEGNELQSMLKSIEVIQKELVIS